MTGVELRSVETEEDIEAFLDVRRRVDPEHPITRANFDDDRDRPDRIDVLAWRDGEPVGAAWAMFPSSSSKSEFMYVSVRVPAERRRRGVGTLLFASVSEHARALGRGRLYTVTRHDDQDTLAYLAKRGYLELTRMEDVALDLTAELPPAEALPAGIEIAPLTDEHEAGMWEVAKEANPDVPSPDPIEAGTFEDWRRRELGPLVYRELSFVALEDGEVVGWATLGEDKPGSGQNYMTAVARRGRGRGVARALKLAQIHAAREAGLRRIRTQNDVANVPMRRVNDRLGYRLRLAWIHLGGPLLR
jgi:GNAT superfamily N-acetyltransferase